MKNFIYCLVSLVAFVLMTPLRTAAQTVPELSSDADFMSAVLHFCGAADAEELDSSEMERFYSFRRHPLQLNTASQSRLQLLLDPWRAASLIDYRDRHGAILSWTELSAVDGFSPSLVAALRPFAALDTALPEGMKTQEALLRTSVRKDEDSSSRTAWSVKYRYTDESRFQLALAAKNSYSSDGWRPEDISGALCLYGRGRHFKSLVLGDYHARFGSGLSLWSGFSIGGVSAVSSFSRRGSGVTPAWTLSPSSALRGAAASFQFGRVSVVPMVSFAPEGGSAALAMGLLGRRSEQTLTIVTGSLPERMGRASFCDRRSLGHLRMLGLELGSADIGAEFALDTRSRALASSLCFVLTPAYGRKVALQARWYPSNFTDTMSAGLRSSSRCRDEAGGSLGLLLGHFESTLDASRKISSGDVQCKSVSSVNYFILDSLKLSGRVSVRLRPQDEYRWRRDLRFDILKDFSRVSLHFRANYVWGRDYSQLYYAEAGDRSDAFRTYLRLSAFAVDRWDDRIYCYERDVYQYFNVPAYYGRGVSLSLTGSVAVRRQRCRHRLGWRLSCIHYTAGPLTTSKGKDIRAPKPDRLEARIQYML